jgi:hypothetical protein
MTIKLATVTATLLLSVLPALTQPALTIDCENPTFASHERLVAAFGKDNATVIEEPGPKGMAPNVKSVVYPKDPKRRLEVRWQDGGKRARPFAFTFEKPSQWVAPLGVRIGSSLEELEKIDGKPFGIAGFGGLLDGMVSFSGTLDKLPGGCSLGGNMEPTAKLWCALMLVLMACVSGCKTTRRQVANHIRTETRTPVSAGPVSISRAAS